MTRIVAVIAPRDVARVPKDVCLPKMHLTQQIRLDDWGWKTFLYRGHLRRRELRRIVAVIAPRDVARVPEDVCLPKAHLTP